MGVTPARGRYPDVGGSTPGLFGMTPTAAGYTPFRRPVVEERAAPLPTSPDRYVIIHIARLAHAAALTLHINRMAGEEQPPARSLYDELGEEVKPHSILDVKVRQNLWIFDQDAGEAQTTQMSESMFMGYQSCCRECPI